MCPDLPKRPCSVLWLKYSSTFRNLSQLVSANQSTIITEYLIHPTEERCLHVMLCNTIFISEIALSGLGALSLEMPERKLPTVPPEQCGPTP